MKLVGESFANKLVVRIYIKFSMFLFSFLLNFALRGEEECKSPLLHGNTIIVTSYLCMKYLFLVECYNME